MLADKNIDSGEKEDSKKSMKQKTQLAPQRGLKAKVEHMKGLQALTLLHQQHNSR